MVVRCKEFMEWLSEDPCIEECEIDECIETCLWARGIDICRSLNKRDFRECLESCLDIEYRNEACYHYCNMEYT